jgi:hypothetical protein
MTKYQNLNGNSGVTAYEIGDDFIRVQFTDGGIYLYTNNSSGAEHITEMKQLAKDGAGLNTYINQHVRKNYESAEK